MAWSPGARTPLHPIPDAAKSGVSAVAGGSCHSLALKSDGTVVTWGRNDLGQSTVPPEIQGPTKAIACGHTTPTTLNT